jgi:hypothetical protein
MEFSFSCNVVQIGQVREKNVQANSAGRVILLGRDQAGNKKTPPPFGSGVLFDRDA